MLSPIKTFNIHRCFWGIISGTWDIRCWNGSIKKEKTKISTTSKLENIKARIKWSTKGFMQSKKKLWYERKKVIYIRQCLSHGINSRSVRRDETETIIMCLICIDAHQFVTR